METKTMCSRTHIRCPFPLNPVTLAEIPRTAAVAVSAGRSPSDAVDVSHTVNPDWATSDVQSAPLLPTGACPSCAASAGVAYTPARTAATVGDPSIRASIVSRVRANADATAVGSLWSTPAGSGIPPRGVPVPAVTVTTGTLAVAEPTGRVSTHVADADGRAAHHNPGHSGHNDHPGLHRGLRTVCLSPV